MGISIKYKNDINCSKCGRVMFASSFVEREYDNYDLPTGRIRYAVDKLYCPHCFNEEPVDSSFDGDWYMPFPSFLKQQIEPTKIL